MKCHCEESRSRLVGKTTKQSGALMEPASCARKQVHAEQTGDPLPTPQICYKGTICQQMDSFVRAVASNRLMPYPIGTLRVTGLALYLHLDTTCGRTHRCSCHLFWRLLSLGVWPFLAMEAPRHPLTRTLEAPRARWRQPRPPKGILPRRRPLQAPSQVSQLQVGAHPSTATSWCWPIGAILRLASTHSGPVALLFTT